MKRILIDPGDFYTKVCVFAEDHGAWRCLCRRFFPAVARRMLVPEDGCLSYRHDDGLYKIGWDCAGLGMEVLFNGTEDFFCSDLMARLLVQKALFDFADPTDDIRLDLVVGTPGKLRQFKTIVESLDGNRLKVEAIRGGGKQLLTKTVELRATVIPASDGLSALIGKTKEAFSSAAVLDVGYNSSRAYVITPTDGVVDLRTVGHGFRDYLVQIAELMEPAARRRASFLWLVRQLESGGNRIETSPGGERFDASLVRDNVRWDLNKIFLATMADMVASFYERAARWVDMLVVIGGGAAWQGPILHGALLESGLRIGDAYVEPNPVYAVLRGIC